MSKYKPPKPFRRFCKDPKCGKLYQPTGRFQKYCLECQKRRQRSKGWKKE